MLLPTEPSSATGALDPGFSFGPYRLQEKIGHGGMGEVWLAEQTEPIHRQVALKVIKTGMDTAQVLARFAAERQALALMNHANIARVFDTGSTPEGRPYFAMEHVKGEAITAFCDRHRLTTPDRLALFQQVCDGVQHAHQKAIIHRDLKPSNILVTQQDDRAVPKIIDFGLAKAMAQPLTDRTLYTELGQMIGTPEYMSPEQADPSAADIDTRSDVYSLGVVLYELVCGTLPFDRRVLHDGSMSEFQRQIREVDPPLPSTRCSTPGAETSTIAERRRTDPPGLRRALRGDLDWITMKALAKERARRYASVSELRADIERHLRNEPVLASPPSRARALVKFMRRHRAGVAAAGVVGLALVAATVISVAQARRAQQAEARAQNEATTARQVSDFLAGIFDDANPGHVRRTELTAREVLDNGAARIESDLRDQPEVQGRLLSIIGGVHARLGHFAAATRLLEQALVLAEKSGDALRLAAALDALALNHSDQGRTAEALPLVERAVATLEHLGDRGEVGLADTLNTQGNVLIASAQYGAAERALARGIALLDKLGRGADASAYHVNIANCRYYAGDYQGALDHYKKAQALDEVAYAEAGSDGHYLVATSLHNTALVYTLLGRYAEALPLETRALAIREKVLGPEHWHTALSLSAMAELRLASAELAEAEALVRRAIAIDEKQFAPDKTETASDLDLLGRVLVEQGRLQDARAAFERSLGMRLRLANAADIASSHASLGDWFRRSQDSPAAEREYHQALSLLRPGDEGAAITRFSVHSGLARLWLDRNDAAKAHAEAELARTAVARAWPSGHPDLAKLDAALAAMTR